MVARVLCCLVLAYVFICPIAAWASPGAPHGAGAESQSDTPLVTLEEQRRIRRTLEGLPMPLSRSGTQDFVIPTQVHIIYDGVELSRDYISDADIEAELADLSANFTGASYTFSFQSIAPPTRTLDTHGWFGSLPWDPAWATMTSSLSVDPASTLNIYVTKMRPGSGGWAPFPWTYSEASTRHGFAVDYRTVRPERFQGGAPLSTHEAGHYFGLFHTFQNGCELPGDEVDDTTPHEWPSQHPSDPTKPDSELVYTCDVADQNYCSQADSVVTNYMTYADPQCYTSFTPGQFSRMAQIIYAYRPTLVGAPVLGDGFEDNDSCGEAAALPLGDYRNLVVGAGDDDWYEILIPGGHDLQVEARFLHSGGDIDLYLFAECGGLQLDESTGYDNDENLSYLNSGGSVRRVLLWVKLESQSSNSYDLDVVAVDLTPPCQPQIVAPNGAEVWDPDDENTVSWNTSGSCGANVAIELLRDGQFCQTLALSTPNDGSLVIPAGVLESCADDDAQFLIRLIDQSTLVSDTSDAPFNVVPSTLTVRSPDGGEAWSPGEPHDIRWQMTGLLTTVDIAYSVDGGASFAPIVNDTPNDGLFEGWIVPNEDSSNCFVRVSSASNPQLSDTSESPFVIVTPETGIDLASTIQAYSDSGSPASPLAGQSVTVRGVLTVLKNTFNSGDHYVQDQSGGVKFFDSGAQALSLGDLIEVTGTVGTFGSEINLSGPFTYVSLGTGSVGPLVLTISRAIDFDASDSSSAGDYELVGRLLEVTGNVVFLPGQEAPPFPSGNGQGSFGLTDSSDDTLNVFIDRSTNIDVSGLQEGDLFRVTGVMSKWFQTLQLQPRSDADLLEDPDQPAPVIGDVMPSPWTPRVGESILCETQVSDDGAVVSVELYFRERGASDFASVSMGDAGAGAYRATIPGQTAMGIEYYVRAVDDDGGESRSPGGAPEFFHQLAVGTTPIATIQSQHQPGSDESAWVGELVNVEGVVTVEPGLLTTSLTTYVVADPAGGPWSGLWVFETTGSNALTRGHRIRIGGFVEEFAGMTEIIPLAPQAVEVIEVGQPHPPIATFGTAFLDTTEAYEAVVVRSVPSTVAGLHGGGSEWWIQDASSDSALYVDPAPPVTRVATLGEVLVVTGVLDTRFSRNELVPIDNDDVANATSTDQGTPGVGVARIRAVAPNPFNPATEIRYSVPTFGPVDVSVFDARGRMVATLVSDDVDPGDHEIVWRGVDDNGQSVASGSYFVRLVHLSKPVDVVRLTLLK